MDPLGLEIKMESLANRSEWLKIEARGPANRNGGVAHRSEGLANRSEVLGRLTWLIEDRGLPIELRG